MPLDGHGSERWWLDESDGVHTALVSTAKRVRDNDHGRHQLDKWHHLYLYGHADIIAGNREAHYTTYNVVREAVDAMHARISKGKPNVEIVPSGADWQLTDRSELLTTWIDGEFERIDVHALTGDALHDACIFGTGALQSYVGPDGRPTLELVYRGDLSVDPREERKRCVRTLYKVMSVDRTALAERFPEHEKAIEDATGDTDPDEPKEDGVADLVLVYEAWRLGIGDKPGRHVIAIEGVTLTNEEWPADEWFPFAFMHYSRNPRGFWGIGLPERMCGTQADLNELCSRITESYRLWIPRLCIWSDGGMSVDEFNNAVGSVHMVGGEKPPFILAPMHAIGQDFINREIHLATRMLQSEGISVLGARSEKPAGLNSGKALIVHQDVESERHIVVSRAFETLHVDVAKMLLRRADEIADDEATTDKSKLRAMGGKRILDVVDYEDARMQADQYRARAQPVSSFSRSLAGKLQEIDIMLDRQLITDPDEARDLLDMPDLQRNTELRLSPRNVAKMIIDHAARGRDVTDLLLEEIDIPWALDRCRRVICMTRIEKRPESKIGELRRLEGWLATQKAKLDAAMAPPPQPAGPPPGAPPGGGVPMPAPMMGMGGPMAA